ncbi:MAG: MAPEG family protein [Aestuariibacter sp.]
MTVPITTFYAALLGVLLLYLSLLVVARRREFGIGIGDGGEKHLQQDMRVHGNFIEYVPFTLVLLLLAELNHMPTWFLHTAGVVLLLSRLMHAYGLRHHHGYSWQRFYGTLLTFVTLAALIVANLLPFYDQLFL